MDQKQRCQSCGMPIGEGFYGTEADGSVSNEFCKFCYQHGAFTMPDLTVEGAVDASVKYMTNQMGYDQATAEQMSREVITKLKRWA
jgi:hypothetical protein